MLTDKRILNIKQEVFEDETVSDGTAVRHGISIDTQKSLRPDISREISKYKRNLNVETIADAVANDDRKELLTLTDWSLVNYDGSRLSNRIGLVSSSIESWEHRDYLESSGFAFNQNNKNIDKYITALIAMRILTFNSQERKRISTIFRMGRSAGWSSEKIAQQIKFTAGLNSIQQKALFNIQSGMIAQGFSTGSILKKTDSYISKALAYRVSLTSQWEAASVVNEGQAQLWEQLEKEELIGSTAQKEWETILDNVTGTADRAMNGQRVLLGAKFVDPTLTYSPIKQPPLRGNCRCGMKLIP